MGNIVLEGRFINCNSYFKDDNLYFNKVQKYYAYFLIDLRSEICYTQLQFITDETKSNFWTKEEKQTAFCELKNHIKSYIDTNSPIYLFRENLFFPKMEQNKNDEPLNSFELEIQENSKIFNKLCEDLKCIKDAQEVFKVCKDKLFNAIDCTPALINNYYGGITNLLFYLSNIYQSASYTNSENMTIIRSAFEELRNRKNMNNENYKTTLNNARNKIYCLEFPKYFKTELPKINIEQVLNEIR